VTDPEKCPECDGLGEIELAWLWAPDEPYAVIACPKCQEAEAPHAD
jgi:ssDNA-binding Zn-finger/Zn-ribbon topoisomerase 1